MRTTTRTTRYISFAFKKNTLITCSLALVFFSLTFMYTSKSPISSGVYPVHKRPSTVKMISREHYLKITSNSSVPSAKHPKRINIFIISYPRSGSSFLGNVFNYHPGVFYLFEPLRTVQRSFSKDSLFEFNFSLPSYQNRTSEFLEDTVNCKFSSGIFIRYLIPQDRNNSLALTSPPFCVKNGTSSMVFCQLKSQDLESVCRNKYNVFAAKLLTPRIPGEAHDVWSKNLLQSCSSNGASKCKVIHLVRDPRAVVNSLKSVGFFRRKRDPNPRRELPWYVKKICRQMEFDIKAGSVIRTYLPDGYRLIRFEDLAHDPLSAVSELYDFTGIEMLDSIKRWLSETTTSRNGSKSAYSTTRDSKKVVSSWRSEMSIDTVEIVENYCKNVMKRLHYTLLLRNPIYLEKVLAKTYQHIK